MTKPFAGKTAILIEDDTNDEYRRELEELGFDVLAVTSHKLIDAFPPDRVDIIITDNHIYLEENGQGNDYEVIDWIKKWQNYNDNPNSNTPVIFMTDTNKVIARMAQAIENGMSGFLWKSQYLTDLQEGIFKSDEAQYILRAVLEEKVPSGQLMVTSNWKRNTLDICNKCIATDEEAKIASSRNEDVAVMGKITPEQARLIMTRLTTPKEQGYSGNSHAVTI